jgi:hypothetical protein
MLSNEADALLEAANRVLGLAASDSCGADNEGTIRDGFGDGFEFRSLCKQRRSANGGTRFAESQFIGVHNAQMEEAEVTHGASGGANVERVAWLDEDDAQAVGFGIRRQGRRVYSRGDAMT